MIFAIRAEHADGGYSDQRVAGDTLDSARQRFEMDHPFRAPFDWRGAVCFCEGTKPAEERGRPMRRSLVERGRT